MAATINTNSVSINAQRHLATSAATLNTSMQRLSSGLRVNSAKDDKRCMRTQVQGLQVAARNVNDGVSLAQTAEGALGKMGDMLQRMRELAVQAGNVTNSASDRAALQAEVAQLRSEIDRVATSTQFNGRHLLNGSFAGAVFQAGANAGDSITLGHLVNARSDQLSLIAYATDTVVIDASDVPIAAIARYDQAIPQGTLRIDVGTRNVPLAAIPAASSSAERLGQVLAAINQHSATTGVTAFTTLVEAPATYSITLMAGNLKANGVPENVTFNGFDFDTTGIRGGWQPTPASYLQALQAAADAPTFVADDFDQLLAKVQVNNPSVALENIVKGPWSTYQQSRSQSDAQALVDKIKDANNGRHYPPLDEARMAFVLTEPKTNALAKAYSDLLNTHFSANLTAPTGADPDAWTDDEAYAAAAIFAAAEAAIHYPAELNLHLFNHKLEQRGLDDMDISTQAGAWVALKKIDSAMDQVSSARATLGALQTRFESAINNVQVQAENLQAARGRIVDADFAVETAHLSRAQILQQAGTQMVAQAHQLPQQVLQLLGN